MVLISIYKVSILILLDYLFLLFIYYKLNDDEKSFNPYFIGLPILIKGERAILYTCSQRFQSLFYWITYSYFEFLLSNREIFESFNPYFIGLPILITNLIWI